jgi:uncharacterized protein YgiM (DUF1202 family)
MLVLYAQSTHTVDVSVVSKVITEESIPLSSVTDNAEGRNFGPRPMIPGIVLLILAGIISYYFLFSPTHGHFITKKEPPPSTQTASLPEAGLPTGTDLRKNTVTSPVPTEKPQQNIPSDPNKITIPLKKVVVNKEAANVRVAPHINSSRIGAIMKGATLKVIAEQIDQDHLTWYKIVLYEGREGWIASTVVSTLVNK